MGHISSKFKKKQGSVIAPSISIKTAKTAKMPSAASNNASLIKGSGKKFALKSN